MSPRHCRRFAPVCVLILMLSSAFTAEGVVLTIEPGSYGSYRADNSVVRLGNYSFRKLGSGFNWQDRTGTQNEDLSLLSDGTYEIVARDANVVIGSFVNTGGVPSSPSGSISLTGNTINFLTHDIAVSGAAGWRNQARLWSTSFSEFDITRFNLPAASSWSGWYGNLADGNNFSISIANDGTVGVLADARGIGITGGLGQLVFPSAIRTVTYVGTGNGAAAGWNFVALDWATGNVPTAPGTAVYKLYPGQYSFVAGFGTWTAPGGNKLLLGADDLVVKTWTNAASNLTVMFATPEPVFGSILFVGAALTLRRRRA